MYTNIETDQGLAAVQRCFDRYPHKERSDAALIELLRIGLTQNDFEFNEEYFLQVKGTAMGKKFAPAYANIYMAEWEETVFPRCSLLPKHYFRYLDDIWGVWAHGRGELQSFISILNNHHSSIKVTIQETEINFLDTITYKGVNFTWIGILDTKVYFKPTDTDALLHRKSFHPRHTFRGILKAQLLRFHRICSREEDWEDAVRVSFRALRRRGYSGSELRLAKRTFLQKQEEDLGIRNNY